MPHDAEAQVGFVSPACWAGEDCDDLQCCCSCHDRPRAHVLPGHSTAAHLLLGWCASCPGRDFQREASAWRWWAVNHVPEVSALLGPARQPGEASRS